MGHGRGGTAIRPTARPTDEDRKRLFMQVRRQGLEPRTRGLREARPAAPAALAAPMYRQGAQNAHGAQGCTSHPVHDPVHGRRRVPFRVVTLCNRRRGPGAVRSASLIQSRMRGYKTSARPKISSGPCSSTRPDRLGVPESAAAVEIYRAQIISSSSDLAHPRTRSASAVGYGEAR
jgi:hypothetical protein